MLPQALRKHQFFINRNHGNQLPLRSQTVPFDPSEEFKHCLLQLSSRGKLISLTLYGVSLLSTSNPTNQRPVPETCERECPRSSLRSLRQTSLLGKTASPLQARLHRLHTPACYSPGPNPHTKGPKATALASCPRCSRLRR